MLTVEIKLCELQWLVQKSFVHLHTIMQRKYKCVDIADPTCNMNQAHESTLM